MTANSRGTRVPDATFRFGDFTLDCDSRLLMRNGTKIHLSLKAQQLLHLLLLARPRALSRKELYDALWPSTFVCETNLASIINEVRRALGDDPRTSHYIRTVHGFGYAFCGEVVQQAAAARYVTAKLNCEKQSYSLHEGENSLGRSDDCSIVIAAPTISRRHAVITICNGLFTITDLDSTNGTYVDGRRIGRVPVVVTPQSRITFGALTASIISRTISSTTGLRLNAKLSSG